MCGSTVEWCPGRCPVRCGGEWVMVDEDRLREVREAKARFGAALLRNPDVHGIGVGRRRRGGEKTDELAIVVHVQHKRSEADVEPRRLLPKSVHYVDRERRNVEVGVDVVERPVPVPEVGCGDCGVDLEDRVRPVLGGYSGGPPTSVSNGGTLGGWLWDTVTDQLVVISNEHVFGGAAGTDISQPSIFDGGSLPADRIADVLRAGTLDVSIAAPATDDVYELEIECGGPGVYEFADAAVDMVVQKTGQTTGLTCGVVELIDYDSGHYGSRNDLWIDGDGNDFSMGGDSGSLYLERDHPEGQPWRRVVGIHWGGSGNDGVGHPIQAVVDDLSLTTVCDGVVSALIDRIFGRDEEAEAERALARRDRPGPGDARRRLERRRWRPPRRRRTFARTVESRLRQLDRGSQLVGLIHRHRVDAVRVFLDPDGRRALRSAAAPLARGSVTSDDVLAYQVTDDDVANLKRLLTVAERIGGRNVTEAVAFGRRLIEEAAGRSVRELLA